MDVQVSIEDIKQIAEEMVNDGMRFILFNYFIPAAAIIGFPFSNN